MNIQYEKENQKKKIMKDICESKAILEAYKAIKRVYKKDGKPFAILSKNFEGCTIKASQYASQPGKNQLWVYGYGNGCGHVSDRIDLYSYVKDMKEEEIKHDPIPKISMLKQLYAFDCDEIEEAIKREIVRLEKKVERLQNLYDNFDKITEKLEVAIENFRNEMGEDIQNYEIRELIRNVFKRFF